MEPIWLKSYPSSVPHVIDPDRYASLNVIFHEACRKYTKQPAYVNMKTALSYSRLEKKARDFSAFLQTQCGLKKGDRIALMMPNILQYPIALFGALDAGLVVVNVNPMYTPRELQLQLMDSGAQTIVVLANFAHNVEEILGETSLKNIIVTELGDCLRFPMSMVVNDVVKYVKKMVPQFKFTSSYSFKNALKLGKTLPFTAPMVTGDDMAFLQYTGGTTGVSKGAILSHRNMVANVLQAHAWVKPWLYRETEIVITALPLYHIFALTANCLLFLHEGAKNILITDPRNFDGFIKIIRKSKFSAITGVNTLFNALLHHPEFAKVDFSRLHLTLGGGMAVQKVVAETWKQVTGKPIYEAYGLTETSPAVCINPMNSSDYTGYIGLPMPSTEVTVCDENGTELGTNEVGELCVRGPQVCKGYWNQPEETAKAFNENGWFRTGDIAVINDDGYVKIVDRKKDMILVSGFNVYPNEVEDVIALHPDVKEVAVVGVPSEASGEKVRAYIVKKNESLTESEIIHFCRERLTGYKIPHEILFRDELPKTNVGKILRRALRKEAELGRKVG